MKNQSFPHIYVRIIPCNLTWPSIPNRLELEICLATSEKDVINMSSYGDYYNLQYFL